MKTESRYIHYHALFYGNTLNGDILIALSLNPFDKCELVKLLLSVHKY